MNSEPWGTSAAPLYRFLCCCLTTSHLLLSILLTESSATEHGYINARGVRVNRIIRTACHHLFSHVPMLVAGTGLCSRASQHWGVSACGPLLCTESQGFGLDFENCVSSQMYCFPKLLFLFKQSVLCVS